MKKQLSRGTLKTLLQAEDIEELTTEVITDFFLSEEGIAQFAPDGFCQVDPRNGDRIVYNTARARRPHDNRPSGLEIAPVDMDKDCVICQGKTTQVIDVADLGEGFTFINKNLFPIFYPDQSRDLATVDGEELEAGKSFPVGGFHFLQWTSSIHDKDWHNMPLDDRVIVMNRLAVLEKKLADAGQYVQIIKNYGRLVGGSLVHGHQQIGASNIMPNRTRQNVQFREAHGETFSTYLLRVNPPDLAVRDYGPAVLLTPYFMRRPYDMMLVIKDTTKSYLHELTDEEIAAVADGWQDGIRIILTMMPNIGRETAYNITTHNGPGAGLSEFLPYTQEMGGFEHLGLYLCQGNPIASADYAREILAGQF